MREAVESIAAALKFTGGVALLLAPAAIPLLLFGGLVAAGRGYWGRGTESRQWARDTLLISDNEEDLRLARRILQYY